jgi:hypothetical protein
MLKTLEQACKPRASVFDPSVRDTVYNIDDLNQIDAHQFFAENYATQGMRQLLTEAFKRLEGKSESASGAFLLSQSMGGGKTHNLLALGLLAKTPALRQPVMGEFYQPGPLGAVRVVTFSGRKTNTPFGLWGDIAEQINKKEVFKDFYSPLKPPGDAEWVELLRGEPVLLLLDELPPYFEAAQAVPVGATTLDRITTTAIANLLVAVSSGKLPNACVVLTDLRASAYGAGSAAVSEALNNLESEARRGVTHIDPVRLASDELYHILRMRLFESVAEPCDIEAVGDAYAAAVDEARKMDLTTASPQHLRAEVVNAYPFHPGIRDLYARFKENPGFQQTRALIRIMRIIVADMWQVGAARRTYLIGAHDIDMHRPEIMSEIRQINPTLETAIAHDVASEGGTAVAEQIDGREQTDAQDAAKLIFLSSLSRAVNPTLGLDRSEIVSYLAAPGRDVALQRNALDKLQAQAWYLHATAAGALLFKNVENLNAKLESYAQGMLGEQRETELRERLREMFAPRTNAVYQELQPLPALDQVQLTQDRTTLVIFRPSPSVQDELKQFYEHQQFKNRVLFLTGAQTGYNRVLERSAYLRAIRLIVDEFRQQGMRESDPQMIGASQIQTREESQFYLACRETFQRLLYPTKAGLTSIELEPKYVANKYEGEQQILAALKEAYKYREEVSADDPSFRTSLENKLWPSTKQVSWGDIKRRAATDPSWLWHHPRALDDLKDALIKRDIWRDIGGGFVERGPFPKPKTSVTIQQLARDPNTGEVTLRIRPLHADAVYRTDDGSDTTSAPKLDSYDVKTREISARYIAIDSAGQHEPGEPVIWTNTIDCKYRFFQQDGRLMCELMAIPAGTISYTLDGSSPEHGGKTYEAPFPVPDGTRFVLARASEDGVTSNLLKADVPEKGKIIGPVIDPQKPGVWKRQLARDSTGETFQFLETIARHNLRLGGVRLDAGREGHWASLWSDDQTYQAPPVIRDQATMLTTMLGGGNLTLQSETIQFARGQDLLDLVADLKTAIKPNEVEQ